MTSFEDARATILGHVQALGPEILQAYQAVGRVLAEDLAALRDSPPGPPRSRRGAGVRGG